jgi:hypothetical protein
VRVSDLAPSLHKQAHEGLPFAVVGLLVAVIWSVATAATVTRTLLAICVWRTSVGAL